jgi:iron(III) transport system permease protein
MRSIVRGRAGSIVLLAAIGAFFALFLVYPVWLTVRGGFESASGGLTLYHVGQVVADPALRGGLVNAMLIATATTALCLLLAVPLAVLAVRCEFPGRRAAGVLVLAPLILPPFVAAIGFTHLLGRSGALNTLLQRLGLIEDGIDFLGRGGFWAIVVVEALHLYPILYLSAVAALAHLDPAQEQAAESLGAGRLRRLLTIVLPQLRPALFGGCSLVFVWSLTELGTPLMFDYPQVTAVQIYNGIKAMAVSHRPYALTAVLLLVASGSYVLGRFVFGGRLAPADSRPPTAAAPRRPRRAGAALAAALFWGVIGLALLPHAGVVLTSFCATGQWYRSVLPADWTLDHYAAALSHPLAVGSIRNSLLYSAAAAALDVALGLAIGYLVVRSRVPGRRVLDVAAMVPLAVPGLVMAFGYVAMTLRWPLGSGDPLEGLADVIGAEPNPLPLLVVAYAVRRLPYTVRVTVAGLEQTSPDLEDAAMSLGAGRLRVTATVVAPLIWANLVAGGILAFSFAMLEVSDSLVLAQREDDFPLTKAIFVLFERLGDGQYIASALGVWAMALLAAALLGAWALLGRGASALVRA